MVLQLLTLRRKSDLDSMEMVNVRGNADVNQDASGPFSAIVNGTYHLVRGKCDGDEERMDQGYVTTRSSSYDSETRVQNPTSTNPDTQPFRMRADDALTPNYMVSSRIYRSISSSSEFTRPCPNVELEPNMADIVGEANTPNIVIFGEAGVGKSCVVNLIAGEKRTHVSNDALGCTFQHQRHVVSLNETPLSLWDTTGLDEGSEGRVPAEQAESNLRALIQRLADSGGIHLVVYCIRGSRLTKALKHNYDLFYGTVCRKKVPVALVVTGLEYQQGKMETWWEENEAALRRLGMSFDAHACVTTLDVDGDYIRERRLDSQRQLRKLVAEYAKNRPLKVETSSISWGNLRGVPSVGKKTSRRVIIFDATSSCRTHAPRLIGERHLEWEEVYINDLHAQSRFGKTTGTTVLVFYTSALPSSPRSISLQDLDTLRLFYDSAGGKKCQVILVLRGCNDGQVAQRCWDAVASNLQDRYIQVRPVVDERAKLDAMIEELFIDEKPSRLHRAYENLVEFLAAIARLPGTLGETLYHLLGPGPNPL